MAARLDSVAKYICERSGWTLSNLRLQKILYLAQMFYMGRNEGALLFDGVIQAWDYGPVVPELYHRAKDFGSSPVDNIFSSALSFEENDPRLKVMDDVVDRFTQFSGGELVGITHWGKGAWARHYHPGTKDIRIPNDDIWQEYKDRQECARK